MTRRSWAWRVTAAIAVGALALGLVACGGSSSSKSTTKSTSSSGGGTGGSKTLDVAFVTTAKHPYGIAVQKFADQVNATGKLTIKPQPAYPQAEGQLLADVRSGVVPMATVSSAIWDTAGITAFQGLQAPFLITNYPLAKAVEGGSIGQAMIKSATAEAGDLHVLAIHEGGLRKPFGKTPLVKPSDYKGKTIRAPQSQVLASAFKALGANVEPLPLPEVTQALQNGTIDGVEANLPLIYTQQWYQQAKYVTGNVNFWPFPTVLVVNKAVWDGLSAAQQKALTDAAGKITDESIAIFTTPGSTVAQDLVNCGIKYVYATDADKAALATAAQGAIKNLAPESQKFVTQIQSLSKTLPKPPPPPPLPSKPTGSCKPPTG